MPYIKKEDREKFDKDLELLSCNIKNVGEMNYVITMLIGDFIKTNGECYNTLNSVVGVLECAKLELYRKKVSKYEDKKIEENGDVY
jgi:hypothetical protein